MISAMVKIQEVMTTNVFSVKPTDTMTKVSEYFSAEEIHHLPVVDNSGKVVGIISKTDYHRLQHGFTLFKSRESETYNAAIMRSLLVQDVMTKQVVTLLPSNSLFVAVDIFKENLFHAIPVVDGNRNLRGIITTYDLLNYAYTTQG